MTSPWPLSLPLLFLFLLICACVPIGLVRCVLVFQLGCSFVFTSTLFCPLTIWIELHKETQENTQAQKIWTNFVLRVDTQLDQRMWLEDGSRASRGMESGSGSHFFFYSHIFRQKQTEKRMHTQATKKCNGQVGKSPPSPLKKDIETNQNPMMAQAKNTNLAATSWNCLMRDKQYESGSYSAKFSWDIAKYHLDEI